MKKRGFTLIEILIAFSILTLLALMGFMAWQNQVAKPATSGASPILNA
ncbi:prepilin-type N-terminal cleavage/methylation domain-containing protein [Patescibacteria group bacterium]|nr:prepilin-type N-terminal cleavage/methylation domain-containing protein [Patescibacteria group bacterium]MBU2459717.1 prepilin-type N-terminal cleavage/methylation domain-containing protein [Patescibacteria group bacterium]MBU2543878.1 prepilin-type N-terminal cleavage/methylation domain-containing protein [Patescibacteria group bacterium]